MNTFMPNFLYSFLSNFSPMRMYCLNAEKEWLINNQIWDGQEGLGKKGKKRKLRLKGIPQHSLWVSVPQERLLKLVPGEKGISGEEGCVLVELAQIENHNVKPHRVSHSVQFSSVQSLSCVRLFVIPWTTAHQASLSITNSPSPPKLPCPLSQWCHPTILSSVIPFSSCPQSFPALGSFQMTQRFPSGGQSIGVSASTSVLPMNTQDWSPLGWTGWISLQSKISPSAHNACKMLDTKPHPGGDQSIWLLLS